MIRQSRHWLWFLGAHLAAGTLAAVVFVVALFATDTFGLAALVRGDADGMVAVALLSMGVWVTFGGLALGAGIMGLGAQRRRHGGGGPQRPIPAMIPISPRSGLRSSR